MLWMSPPCRPSALRVVVGPAVSSFGPSCCCWGVRVGIGPCRVVVGPAVSSFGALRVVLRPFVFLGCPPGYWGVRVVAGPFRVVV
jgi:hypothetical protein